MKKVCFSGRDKAAGPDGLPLHFLKDAIEGVQPELTKLEIILSKKTSAT